MSFNIRGNHYNFSENGDLFQYQPLCRMNFPLCFYVQIFYISFLYECFASFFREFFYIVLENFILWKCCKSQLTCCINFHGFITASLGVVRIDVTPNWTRVGSVHNIHHHCEAVRKFTSTRNSAFQFHRFYLLHVCFLTYCQPCI